MTQKEYERLLGGIAGAIGTQRRFITIESEMRISESTMRYVVKRKGSYYRYKIEEISIPCGKKYKNLGLII